MAAQGSETRDYKRYVNTKAVLRCIEKGKEMPSRARIARCLGLSRTTISIIVNELIQKRVVCESCVEANSICGRPGTKLRVSTEKWFALGAAYYSKSWTIIIANLAGDIVYKDIVNVGTLSPGRTFDCLAAGLEKALRSCPGSLIPRIGLGVPGFVDKENGVIVNAADLDWKNIQAKKIVEDRLRVPVEIINRHHASALAEAVLGVGRDYEDVIYIGLSTGAITADLKNGRFIIGNKQGAGEIGHTIIDFRGPVCDCGKRGCLQSVVSETRLMKTVLERYRALPSETGGFAERARSGACPSIAQIRDEASANENSICHEEIIKVIRYLAIACSNLISMFIPQVIIIGGPMSAIFECPEFLGLLKTETAKYTFPLESKDPDMVVSALGLDSGAVGACLMIIDEKVDLIP